MRKKKIKIVVMAFGFMGEATLKSLKNNNKFEIAGVVLPPVKSRFYYNNKKNNKNDKIKILRSDSLKKFQNFVKFIKPDIVIISSFNKIIKSRTLRYCKFLNIHHGRLPSQKGRASINWAIIHGRNQIYISIHEVNKKLDDGRLIIQKKIKILKKDNYHTIKNKINSYLIKNISSICYKYISKKFNYIKKPNIKSTWNCGRNPEDGMINFYSKRKDVNNLIRGLSSNDFPAFCFLKNKKIFVLKSNIKSKTQYEGIVPGRIIKIYKNGNVDCLCSDGILTIEKILCKKKVLPANKIISSTRFTLLND